MNIRRFLRYFTYFRRAHSIYLSFLISVSNFVVIQYRLLVQQVPMLNSIFASLSLFAICFISIYVPFAVILGWIDYNKLSVRVDAALIAKHNPYAVDVAKALYFLASGESDKAKEVLEKWIKP